MSNDENTDTMNKDHTCQEEDFKKTTHESRSRSRHSSPKSAKSSKSPKKSKSKKKNKKNTKSRKVSTSSHSSSSESSPSRSPPKRSRKRNHGSKRKRSVSRSHSRSSRGSSISRSRSRSHSYSRSRSRRPRRYNDYGSRNPPRNGRRQRQFRDTKNTPPPNRVLGCFGLSNRTTDDVLHREFEQFGKIEQVILITDRRTGQSKGYGFIYFSNVDDATEAKNAMSGIDLDGRTIRVDYSLTKRPHSPTPGNYMGMKDRASDNRGNHNRNGRRRERSHSKSME